MVSKFNCTPKVVETYDGDPGPIKDICFRRWNAIFLSNYIIFIK